MKSLKKITTILFIVFSIGLSKAQVGIGTTNPAAALDITATDNGLLIPRVSLLGTNVVDPLVAPTLSEIVYNINDNSDDPIPPFLLAARGLITPGFYFWNGATWERFVTGALPPSTGWLTTGNTGIVDGTNFIGTTTAANIQFRRNNTHAGRISATSTSFGVGALTAGATTNGTAFGVSALAANTAANNTAVGTNALLTNISGTNNSAVGFDALRANTGSNNTAFGVNALRANDTPADNTAVGYNALAANTLNSGAGNQNTAIGSGALDALNGGARNTAVGANALTGVNGNASLDNVAVGYNALPGSGTIDQSVAVGAGASSSSGTGSTRSTTLGYNAGSNTSQSIDNVIIGHSAQASTNSTSRNQVVIGAGAIGTADNSVRLGNTTITVIGGQVGFTVTSDKRWKNTIKDSPLGLDFIQTLRPVSYIRNNDVNKKTEYGFIAQELETALINAGDPNNAIISKDDAGMYGVRYNDFISISIKAIQEQQEQIEELKKANEELQKMNALILKRLEALEKK